METTGLTLRVGGLKTKDLGFTGFLVMNLD